MDLLAQHEAFLRAIFDAPDDDTPRLVYADFLQENSEEDRAEFIRIQCELLRWNRDGGAERDRLVELDLRQTEIARRLGWNVAECERGFETSDSTVRVHANALKKPQKYRADLVMRWPSYFGAQTVASGGGTIQTAIQIRALLALAAFARVRVLDLRGHESEYVGSFPAVTSAAVEAIAIHPWSERLQSLVLPSNALLDEAARSLVESPYLNNLTELYLGGNSFSPAMWQRLVDRFGASVTSGQLRRPVRIGSQIK